MNTRLLGSCCAATLALVAHSSGQSIIFDDFNADEGHFTSDPNTSGSSLNDAATSVADRLTIDGPFEGLGYQRMQFDWEDNADAGTDLRIRHLSGGGTPGNNTTITTTSGVDGWIGFFLRTTTPGWTVQLWLEGPENNGSVPKTVISDGLWHVYEWNLDDETGGADGWGAVAGIVAGDADFQNGAYTIDSIVFRDGTTPSSTIDVDFVAKSSSGSIATLVPEPASVCMFLLGAGCIGLRRRRATV